MSKSDDSTGSDTRAVVELKNWKDGEERASRQTPARRDRQGPLESGASAWPDLMEAALLAFMALGGLSLRIHELDKRDLYFLPPSAFTSVTAPFLSLTREVG